MIETADPILQGIFARAAKLPPDRPIPVDYSGARALRRTGAEVKEMSRPQPSVYMAVIGFEGRAYHYRGSRPVLTSARRQEISRKIADWHETLSVNEQSEFKQLLRQHNDQASAERLSAVTNVPQAEALEYIVLYWDQKLIELFGVDG